MENQKSSVRVKPLSLTDVSSAFVILGFGLSLAFLVFLIERIVHVAKITHCHSDGNEEIIVISILIRLAKRVTSNVVFLNISKLIYCTKIFKKKNLSDAAHHQHSHETILVVPAPIKPTNNSASHLSIHEFEIQPYSSHHTLLYAAPEIFQDPVKFIIDDVPSEAAITIQNKEVKPTKQFD